MESPVITSHRWMAGTIAACAAIAGGVFLLFAWRGEPPSTPSMDSAGAAPKSGPNPPVQFAQTTRAVPSALTIGSASMPRHPFPEVPRHRRGMPLETDPFGARSAAEQAWLDRNGYPNERQWLVLGGASDAQLAEAARAGDLVAKTLLDARRLERGDDAAMDALLEDAARGATFALELMAGSLAIRKRDPVMAYALSRVVELRGNASIAAGRDVMFDRMLTPMQRAEGEHEALAMFQRIRHLQVTLVGANAPATDPRPVGSGD